MAGSMTRTPLLLPSPTTTVSGRPSRLRPLLALPPRSDTSTPRKNHLRPKILKTLAKPFPTAPLPEIAPIPSPPPPLPHAELVILPEEEVEGEELAVSESVGPAVDFGGSVCKFSATSVLKFGGYVLVVLLFQAMAAVVVMGIARTMKEEQQSRYAGRGGGVGEEVGFMAADEVERRVMEIREMAREVRDRERQRREIVARLNKREEDFKEGGGIEKRSKFRSTMSGFRSQAKGLSGLSGGNGSDPGVDLTRKDAGGVWDEFASRSWKESKSVKFRRKTISRSYD